jgi:hypothetical protein
MGRAGGRKDLGTGRWKLFTFLAALPCPEGLGLPSLAGEGGEFGERDAHPLGVSSFFASFDGMQSATTPAQADPALESGKRDAFEAGRFAVSHDQRSDPRIFFRVWVNFYRHAASVWQLYGYGRVIFGFCVIFGK